MHEGVELPEEHVEHGEQGSNPLVLPVSLTISILAVLVAMTTLLGHRAHTEELLLQSKATDQWAYYQAKNIRGHEMESVEDLLDVLALDGNEKATKAREKYVGQAEKYKGDKEDISEKAKELENERDVFGRRGDRFDAGEALLEIGVVICSVCLLTKKKAFWYAGILLGAAGLVAAATGFLIH
jgi:hypothetical protein